MGGDEQIEEKRMSARVALLVALLAMGAALLITAASSRRAVLRASDTIARGQAETFVQAAREHLRANGRRPGAADLDAFLAQQEAVGLRFVALLGRDGELLASAGEAAREPAVDSPEPGLHIESFEDRVRVVSQALGRPRREGRPGFRDGRGPPRQGAGRRRRPPPPPPEDERPPPPEAQPALLLEFEPLVAAGLEREATRTLYLGAAAAVALTAAAFASWQVLGRRERDERRLAEQRRLASLGEMSAVLAHEIRNPLASLKGHAQLLAERLPEDGPERLGAERVIHEAKRLEDLATSLLDFVRTASVALERSHPADLLRDCVEAVGQGRVDLDVSQAPEVWNLDPMRLCQVLRNLIENAVQVSAPEARVEARCATEGGRLVFEFLDRGEGLPPEGAAPLFEPFHTTRTTGTGLGLAVTRRIVELHGGRIEGRNRSGGGAVFRVELPLKQTEV